MRAPWPLRWSLFSLSAVVGRRQFGEKASPGSAVELAVMELRARHQPHTRPPGGQPAVDRAAAYRRAHERQAGQSGGDQSAQFGLDARQTPMRKRPKCRTDYSKTLSVKRLRHFFLGS
jgi:hypothetical protein